ncbi:MAG: phosphoribosylanthranilate isomerase [Ignavibacteriales bacterium]|nr:MAG: phosphoribosylanthranilate isomerase [Ignavibacteriales bacterium]
MSFTKPRVKICCISSVDEAKLAIKYGASALGLVSSMPSGPGVISDDLITEIASIIPPGVSSFLLTSKQSADQIIEQQRKTGVNTIQICDRLVDGNYSDLKNALPGISIVQVIHVTGKESVEEAISVSKDVNAILLDSGNQNLKIKELGGTGRTHDWDLSKTIPESIACPMFLAGGLNPSNVKSAIEKVQPYGVDICSGVRTNGNLDEQKLKEFFAVINNF